MAAQCWSVPYQSLCLCHRYFTHSREPTSAYVLLHDSFKLPTISSRTSFPIPFPSFPAVSHSPQQLRGLEEAQTRLLRPLAKVGEDQDLDAVREDNGSGGDARFSVEKAENEEGQGDEGLVRAPVEEGNAAVGFYEGRKVDLKRKKGAVIADFLTVFEGLLDRPYGGGQSIAAAGAVVIERVVSDAKILREEEGVNEHAIYELLRVLRLLEMDLELVHAAVKRETLLERLEAAKVHCRQAVLIADAI